MQSVIIIGKKYSSTLGLARSLGEAGYDVRLLALSVPTERIVRNSKYVSKSQCVHVDFFEKDSAKEELQALEELRGGDQKTLIIPCRDLTCMMLERHWDELSPHFHIPNINMLPGELNRFSDKAVQKALAIECGIPTAGGRAYSTDPEGIQAAVKEVLFPCFMKPLSSCWSKSEKMYLVKCRDERELEKWMFKAGTEGECGQVLLEQYLPIDRELSAYGAAANGQVCLPACVETIRNGLGTNTGVAAEGRVVSSSVLGELRPKLESFVKKSGLNGLFCIDLIESEGQIFFSEMNLRMGGSCYGVTMAGANLPAALADMIYHGAQGGPDDIREEVVFESEQIDIDNYLKGFISLKTLWQYLSGDQRHFVRNSEDPDPWKHLLGRLPEWYAKRVYRIVFGKQ